MTSRKCKDDLSRNGLRLSVSNNIDILREKLMKEMMARRKESEKAAAEVRHGFESLHPGGTTVGGLLSFFMYCRVLKL